MIDDAIITYTGRQICPLGNVTPDQIDPVDIAHALSMKVRWAGHCREFYSVGHHSLLVAEHCSPAARLWGLLHDAGEAYLPDVPSPIKHRFPLLVEAEDRILSAVAARFGLSATMPDEVKRFDRALMATEARDLTSHPAFDGALDFKIRPMQTHQVKAAFLGMLDELLDYTRCPNNTPLTTYQRERITLTDGVQTVYVRHVLGRPWEVAFNVAPGIRVFRGFDFDAGYPADVKHCSVTRRPGDGVQITFADGKVASLTFKDDGNGRRQIVVSAPESVHILRSELVEGVQA